MRRKTTKNDTYSFIYCVGLVPCFDEQVPQIGSMLLPMHIPVLLCGLVCGHLLA